MSSSQSVDAPSPNTILFARGVIARLALWPVLRLAIQESWGGPQTAQKRTWLASTLVDMFEGNLEADEDEEGPSRHLHPVQPNQQKVPDEEDVESLLLQIMFDEFATSLEDGSAGAVAKDLSKLWSDTQNGAPGGLGKVREWEEAVERLQGKKVEATEEIGSDEDEDDEDWEDDEDIEMEVPTLIDSGGRQRQEPEVDEDGFTMVKKKGKR